MEQHRLNVEHWKRVITEGKGVRVAKCPIVGEYCYPSCHWRKGTRCCYNSKRGRQIPELKKQ